MKPNNLKLVALMNSFSQGSSGGDIVLVEVVKRLKDFEISIITSELGKMFCEQNGLTSKFLLTTKEKTFTHPIITYCLRTLYALTYILEMFPANVLLGSSDFFPDTVPIMFLKILRPKTVWVQHIFHLIPRKRRISFYAQRVSFIAIRLLADVVIVDNKKLLEELVKMGFNRNKVHVNYLGIRKFETGQTSATHKVDASFMARLKPYKGIYDMIDIWKLVVEKIPDAVVGVIGKGDADIILEINRRISKYGLERNVCLLGFLPNEQAFEVVKDSRVFLFPSHEEGFGLVGLEAQLLGVPVVGWNLPPFEEVFERGMTMFPFGDFESFAQEVINLLSDQTYYNKLSSEAVENSKRFSWDKTAARENALILLALGK
jgi:glycosyltransferase involved in cell wall biosynthesis